MSLALSGLRFPRPQCPCFSRRRRQCSAPHKLVPNEFYYHSLLMMKIFVVPFSLL